MKQHDSGVRRREQSVGAGRRPRSSRCYSDSHTTPASRAAEMVCLHLERGAFDKARAVIDWFQRESDRSPLASVAERISTPLAQIVGARLANALERAGCLYVDDLAAKGFTRARVLGLASVGPSGLAELEAGLARIGLAEYFAAPAAEALWRQHGGAIERASLAAQQRRRRRGHDE